MATHCKQLGFAPTQVAILDPDVHHGNGTNDIFYEDPSVLFISTHQAGQAVQCTHMASYAA